MKTKTLLVLSLSSLLLYGCSLIHFMTVKEKATETMIQYTHYLNSLNIDTSFSYQLPYNYLDSISMEKYAINTYKLKYNTAASPVQIRMYDNTGCLVNGYEQCFGEISKLGILETFPMKKIDHLPVNYKLVLNNDVHLLNIGKEEKQRILMRAKQVDYTIIVFYSEWAGWYSKNTLQMVKKYIERNNESKILFIKVNSAPCIK